MELRPPLDLSQLHLFSSSIRQDSGPSSSVSKRAVLDEMSLITVGTL
jgi:hypothetical protein